VLQLQDADQAQPPVSNADTQDKSSAQADRLLSNAYQADTVEQTLYFLQQVLELNPNCIDAYLLLAERNSRSQQQFVDYLEQAVKAGETSLGSEYFTQNRGHFWGLHETRPYMQALSSLAGAYRECKRSADAISLYEKSLQLNPNDNQANRYGLLNLYLEQQQLEKAQQLLADFAEDQSAFFLYSKALLCYIREGNSDQARQLRKAAKNGNKHVPKLLSGASKIPKQLPGEYSPGDKREAIIYTLDARNTWRQVMGSVSWLLK